MNNTERLIDTSKNRFTRELLHSAELDIAPDNTVAKVAFALGLGSTAVVATVTSGAAASTVLSAGAASAAGAAPVVSAVTAASMLKVMAIVSLACGTLSYGGVKLALMVTEKPAATLSEATRHRGTISVAEQKYPVSGAVASALPEGAVNVPPPPPVDSDMAAAARGQEQRPDAVEATSPRETSVQPLGRQFNNSNSAPLADSSRSTNGPPAEIPVSQLPVAPSAVAAFPSDDGHAADTAAAAQKRILVANLEREVAELDHARAILAAGQPALALREIDAYRAQNPKGMLAAESVVLRVRALLDMGLRTVAERDAAPILKAAPQSRHAERLRQILGISVDPP